MDVHVVENITLRCSYVAPISTVHSTNVDFRGACVARTLGQAGNVEIHAEQYEGRVACLGY